VYRATLNWTMWRRRLMPDFGGLPRTYWYLWSGMLMNRLGSFVVPFLSLYLTHERHLTVQRAGLVVSLYGLGNLCSGPVGGVLADRLGRRAMLILGLGASSAAMLHLGLARSPWHVAVGTLLLGVFGEIYRPAASAIIAEVVPTEDRARAFGLLYWAVNLAFAFAAVLAGTLANVSFTALFLGDAATTLAFAGLMWLKIPKVDGSVPTPRRARASLAAPFGDAVFAPLVFLMFLASTLLLQSFVTLPMDMAAHGLSAARYGALLSINGLMIVVLQPSAATLVKGVRRSRILSASGLLIGAGFGLTAFASTSAAYAGAIAVWTLGEIAMAGLGPTMAADLSNDSNRAAYQGVFQLSWGAASFAAPAGGSFILGHFGAPTLWGSCLGVGICIAVGHLAIAEPRRRRMAELRGAPRAIRLDTGGP
jgi:MFS family permease